MPELPEVETVVRTLDPLLRWRFIESIDLFWPRTLAAPSLDRFRDAAIGRRIDRVWRRAKLVVIALDDGAAVTIHLRMTGELLYRDATAGNRPVAREPYLRAVFGLSDDAEVLFYDIRKFGRITYRPPHTLADLDRQFGVEPLSPQFTPEALSNVLKRYNRRIKPLLLDQAVIAGLGNIYVDEALFRARIHPLQSSRDIPEERIEMLHLAIRDVLTEAIEARGTTFRNYRSGLGESGSNQARLRVYGIKPGTPCPECGAPLERLVVGQRGSMYCPRCQPLIDITHMPSQ